MGQALYPGDYNLPGQLHAKVLWSKQVHARIKKIDMAAAKAIPGVVAIFTGADLPVNEYGLMTFDAPVMLDDGGPKTEDGNSAHKQSVSRLLSTVSRHYGEKVAFVVAETEQIAAKARDAIVVEYEPLPRVTDIHAAQQNDAPLIHPTYPGNVIYEYNIVHGAGADGFADADVIVEDVYNVGAQEHAYLQPEAGVAYMDDEGRVTVVVGGQWAHEDQGQIAHALDLPLDKVRVIYPAIGGAFGGREDMSVQIVLALAAWKLGRPVKIIWSREESIIGHHKRHPVWARAKLGAKRDGSLVAAEVELLADAGPYNYTSNKVLGNAALTCTGPYLIPNVHVNAKAIVTNNVPGGAFRGFGAPQGLFVAETQINKMAEKLGMDPVELRLKNAWRDGGLMITGSQIVPGCTLVQTLEACKQKTEDGGRKTVSSPLLAGGVGGGPAASRLPSPVLSGRGYACGHKNIGFSFGFSDTCTAFIELHGKEKIEKAILFHAGSDCGQGAHTAMQQVAATALGLPPEKIEMVLSDTATSGSSGSCSASRLTFMMANSVAGAAKLALEKWRNEERPARAEYTYVPRKTTGLDHELGQGDPCITFAYVAQSADVEINRETGHIHVRNFVSADDVGKAVNPQQVQGQIEGAVVQGWGYTSLENFVSKDGRILTNTFSTYFIPSVLDVPDKVESVVLELPDPQGFHGIRGMAELPLMCVAPAVVAAIHNASGVWINDLPLTPERVRNALKN